MSGIGSIGEKILIISSSNSNINSMMADSNEALAAAAPAALSSSPGSFTSVPAFQELCRSDEVKSVEVSGRHSPPAIPSSPARHTASVTRLADQMTRVLDRCAKACDVWRLTYNFQTALKDTRPL
jgi:hypothetical protein